ncbi:MAG TPA: formyltransferase [Syntrophorhabdaceae bacterium]|nr:formyltransferase [Syntrophorhabdaceae bacterium]HQM80051.1 formyltransferase [Syntrophorhabdaceae bacterium]
MRTVVFAYQEIGYVCLEELIDFGADVACLFTHLDDPGEEVWYRRPITVAERHNIPVYTPESLKDRQWAKLVADAEPDIIFSFYYRKMIPVEILDIPRIGAFNLHGSLLPKFRGRCPVNWVLIAGERETGLTLHYMLEKPDAGDMIAQKRVDIDFEDNVYTVYMKMAKAARELMREVLPQLRDGSFARTPQVGASSYFGGRRPEDGMVMWEKDAVTIYNLTRAVTHPYPGAFTYLEGKKFYIWKALPEDGPCGEEPGKVISCEPFAVSTGRGRLRLLSVQLEGEGEMDGESFARSHDIEGKIFGGTA